MNANLDSDLLSYLIDRHVTPGDRVPPLSDLSNSLGISVGKLREQLEAARQMGIISARPRVGIRREPYDFYATMRAGLFFGLASSEVSFEQVSALRRNIESSMFHEAVGKLENRDRERLQELVQCAWRKLREHPIHIPTEEHRELHLTLFNRIDNPLVTGLLEAYWDTYESLQLTRFADYQYWLDVWTYHERIVEAILAGDHEKARRLLVEHFELLPKSPLPPKGSAKEHGS